MRDERMSPDDAERLNVLLLQIQAKLSESVGFIRDHDSIKSSESYGRVVAEILATLQLDIQERLWRDYPHLRPEFLGGPYKIDPKIYEPPFYELKDARMHNKRIEFAPFGRPTRKRQGRLLAAHPRRYAS